MIAESDLLSADVSFDPPLYNKRARTHQVYLIPRSGSIVKGRVMGIVLHRDVDEVLDEWSAKIDIPVTLAYDNRPEYEIKEFPISDEMRESLGKKVRKVFEEESHRIAQRPGVVCRVEPSSIVVGDAAQGVRDEEQTELQAATLSFYPALGIKTREAREVHLTTQSVKIYKGIRIWRGKVNMPSSVVLHNLPEVKERQVTLSSETQKVLKKRIRDAAVMSAAGLL
ncbi:MAG: hypothetical protein U0412_07610 [Nitrospira sp.]